MRRRLVVLALLAAGCRSNSPEAILAYCDRWAAKYVMYGVHADPAAYREDLISSCMAMKRVPYETAQQRAIPSDMDWVNPSIADADRTKSFGRDKASCIERSYVGQASRGSSSGEMGGSAIAYGGVFGSGVSGRQSGSYNSNPVFDSDLFVACMNEAGWELSRPAGSFRPE